MFLDDLNGSYYCNNDIFFVARFFELYFGFSLFTESSNDL